MITFSSVTKKFGSGVVALQDISFHIKSGELVVVHGPSGSGKTTLMNLLIKDLEPTSGEITYKNISLTEMPRKQIPQHRRKIGVVFQDYRLLPELNVWENIALPLSIIGKSNDEVESRVTDLLNLVSLTEKALLFPKQLSGGEAQKVSIARALATGPSLIFADEPTGNLDSKASLEIMRLLQQINDLGTTILLATHDLALLDALERERHLELEKGVSKRDSRPASPDKVVENHDHEDKKAEQKKVEKIKTEDKQKKRKAFGITLDLSFFKKKAIDKDEIEARMSEILDKKEVEQKKEKTETKKAKKEHGVEKKT